MTEPPKNTTGSLLEEGDVPVDEEAKGPTLAQRADARLRAGLSGLRRFCWFPVWRRGVVLGALGLAVAGAGGAVWMQARVQPPPDYESARIDVLFEYTLLTDDFNKLPVEERLALIAKLVERMRALEGRESLFLAAFASMIAGEARAQLEENVSRMAVDLFDQYAVEYSPAAPQAERRAQLKETFLEFTRTMETLVGAESDQTDEERLAEARRQTRRDMQRVQDGRVAASEALRFFDVLNNGVGQHATGHQKIRIATMTRDMVEMLRSEPEP